MIKHHYILAFSTQLCYYIIFIPLILILSACPFSSPYKLDKDASVPVDESLLGKWATMVANKRGKQQPVKITFSKKNDTEYNIDLTGNFNDLRPYKVARNDSIKGTAYLSLVADRPFLNIEIKGQTFISAVLYKNDTLSLLPLADGFTAKYIKSNSDLRTAVEIHIRTRVFPRFDEQFCLREMLRVN